VNSYDDVDSMWAAMIDHLLMHPTHVEARVGSGAMSNELIGSRWVLKDIRRNFLTNESRAADPAYASAELLWYLSRESSVEMLLPYAPSYKRFAEDDGRAHGAYGSRLATNIQAYRLASRSEDKESCDQLDYAVQRLRRDPNTRQLVITMWKAEDLITENKRDLPCTVCWQFLVRENNLHMVTYMRSNDVWLGVPYDIYTFSCIQSMVADSLGLGYGTYTHVAGSLHMYEKNRDDCFNILEYGPLTPTPPHGWERCPVEDAWMAVEHEKCIRKQEPRPNRPAVHGCLLDSVMSCARKLGLPTDVRSPALTKGFQNVDARRS